MGGGRGIFFKGDFLEGGIFEGGGGEFGGPLNLLNKTVLCGAIENL